MPPQIPTALTPLQWTLRLLGVLAVLASLIVAFVQPFGWLHWLLLAAAGVLLWTARRV